jgi:hypothetical protein
VIVLFAGRTRRRPRRPAPGEADQDAGRPPRRHAFGTEDQSGHRQGDQRRGGVPDAGEHRGDPLLAVPEQGERDRHADRADEHQVSPDARVARQPGTGDQQVVLPEVALVLFSLG